MKHKSCVFTDSRNVLGVAAITELSTGQLNVAVVMSGGLSRMEPGAWTWSEAMDLATQWADELLGRQSVPSRWLEGEVAP